ncbi:MAG TPA: hypothetical protein VFN10_20665 [Thermoanaerobaculia bacterium]|nr:hypothetical protein [Thermoanaerobaculia bacterium]
MTSKSLAAGALALLLLSACGSVGDVLGGGSNNGSNNQSRYEIRGTVDYVDANNRSVSLTNVSGYTNMLSNSGSAVRVYYDDNTTVAYNGTSYRPQDLERGDEVTVRVDESGNQLFAESMTVTYDATRSGSTTPTSNGTYGSYATTLHGTVRSVDTSRRTIELDRGYGSGSAIVEYASNTPVYFSGRNYNIADLERGDEVDIRVQDYGNGRYVADDLTVTRSISGTSGSSTSSSYSTIRGTVRYINTSNRTIELESTNWISGFNSGAGTGSTMIVQYDTNTQVSVSGRLYPLTNLERGDVIDVQVRNLGGSSYLANSVTLVRDINSR